MTKAIITSIIVISYLIGVDYGYTENSNIIQHMLFPLSHANIFHLLCNILALYAIKVKLQYIPALIFNFVASYLPFAGSDIPTMGASGILFALIGINWGEYFYKEFVSKHHSEYLKYNTKKFLTFIVLPLIITIFIPNINFFIHFYTLILGLSYPTIKYYVKRI